MASSAKGFRYAKNGAIAKVLKLETFNLPRLAGQNALVEVVYAPIHRTDAAIINGTAVGRVYTAATAPSGVPQFANAPFPRIGGAEGIGRVVDPGTAEGLAKGDLLWIPPMTGAGTWADFTIVDASKAVKLPASNHALPLELLACGTGLIAAHRLLTGYGKLEKGQFVVQNGGSSLIALAVSALAQQRGVKVITAAQDETKQRFKDAKRRQEQYGSEVVAYTNAGALKAKAAILAAKPANGGATAFFNGVGGKPFNSFLKLLGEESRAITYGAQNSYGLMWSGTQHIWKDMTHTGLNTPRYLLGLTKEQRAKAFNDAVTALAEAKFTYPTQKVKLDALPDSWNSTVLNGGKKFIISSA